MAVIGRSVSPWEHGNYVLGHDGECIGPVQIQGLDSALDASASMRRGNLTSIPDVTMRAAEGDSSECGRWLAAWPLAGERRDLLIRDNRKKRWLQIGNAYIAGRSGMSGEVRIVTESVEPTDGPDL
jgi:hypothetical protein